MSKNYTFEILKNSDPIVTTFIPVGDCERKLFDEWCNLVGVPLVPYDKLVRTNMRQQDLLLLVDPVNLIFKYNDTKIWVKFKPSFIWDGASVPISLVNGDLTKFGQSVELASMVHDLIFNQQLLPFDDANNIFEGILKSTNMLSKFVIWEYATGVRSPVGKMLYNKNVPSESWMINRYEWRVL